MTETAWLESSDPRRMFRFLCGSWVSRLFSWSRRNRPSDRKLRLFVAACYRCRWYQRADEGSRKAVEIAESLADGMVTQEEGERHFDVAVEAIGRALQTELELERPDADLSNPSTFAAGCLCPDVQHSARISATEGDSSEAGLLRCIFGNPFRRVQVDPSWLRWHDGAIVHIAQSIYDDRRFEDLPILADALEEAGCTPHARGCWVLDSLLGKE